MRIEEFYVKRYGPLRDRGYTLSHNFNLFFGKNEDGKTLTIDALVRLLLGKKVRDFKAIDRVGENPEGYVILKDDQGMEVKLPQKGMLPKVTGLTPSECRNIFVIRNSDLSISDESGFYISVTDRLIGLRANEISKIKETLREIGRMTPGGFFRDTKEEKLKTRIEDAENLISRITGLAREIEEEGYDELEEESASCRDELDSLTQLIEHLEDARKREKYEKGREALAKLKDSSEKLADLEIYNSESAQIWRDSRRDIQRLEEVKKGVERDVDKEEAELKILTKELNEKERDFQFFEETKGVLDNEVRQELSNYGRRFEELAIRKSKRRFLDSAAILSTVLFGICLLGIISRPVSILYIFGVVLLGLCFLLWIHKFQIVRHEASLAGVFERMRLTLSGFELEAESIERILSNIQGFDEDYRKRKDELQTISRKKESIEEKIWELRQRTIPDLDMKIKDAENRITEFRMISTEGSLEGYQRKLSLRQELEKLADEQRSV
jgi:lipopolysaccharide export LptBFGC system permease protein LptF